MKKRFIQLATRWKYTWIMWLFVLFYIMLLRGNERLIVTGAIWTLFWVCSSSLLLAAGKWWGSCFGIIWAVGFYIEYHYKLYLIHCKGAVIYHLWNPLPVTVMLVAYYIFMGWICYKDNKNDKVCFVTVS